MFKTSTAGWCRHAVPADRCPTCTTEARDPERAARDERRTTAMLAWHDEHPHRNGTPCNTHTTRKAQP